MAPRSLMSFSTVTTTLLPRSAGGIGSGLRDVQPTRQMRGRECRNPVFVRVLETAAACPRSLTSTSSSTACARAGRPITCGEAVRDCHTTALSLSGAVGADVAEVADAEPRAIGGFCDAVRAAGDGSQRNDLAGRVPDHRIL